MSATESNTHGRPIFPSPGLPEEARQARLLGLYGQRQEGLLMQRLKILGGRLELAQWRRLAELAIRYTPGYALHLTTRQDIELHGLQPADVPALHCGLAEVGMSTVGACGDTIRAVTVDPASGLASGSFDMGPLAVRIHAHAQSLPAAFSLPRKFKVSLSGSPEGGARPYINDVGLVANDDGTLRVIVAGSLGVRPNTGILGYERISTDEVLPLITASLRLFEAEGDRQNRSRARLRHVRERLGDETFLRRLADLFQEEKSKTYPPVPALVRFEGTELPSVSLSVPRGDLSPQDALVLIEIAERRGATVRIGIEHDLVIFGLQPDDLPVHLQGWTRAAHVIACPGAHHCQRGVAETWGAADALREALDGSGLLAAISGCPNNCSHAAVADLGLIGRIKTVDGEKRPHYRLSAGGGRGCSARLAVELHAAVPREQVGPVAGWLIEQWQAAQVEAPLSFADFVAREQERLAAGIAQQLET